MYTKHSIKTLVIVGFLLMAAIGLLFPSTSASIETDADDGFWSDSFTDKQTTNRTDCIWDNGTITLPKSTDPREYDFSDGGSFRDNLHKAYYLRMFKLEKLFLSTSLLSPERLANREFEFDETFQYPFIEDDSEYADPTLSKYFYRVVVHHFKFKLDSSVSSVGNINVSWIGKVTGHKNLQLYFWRYSSDNKVLAKWHLLKEDDPDDNLRIELIYNITKDDAKLGVDDDNYVNFLIVAEPLGLSCSLYTNYIKIESELERGYEIGYGTVDTMDWIEPKTISPDADNFYWDILTWKDYQRGSATVKYHVLYQNATGHTVLVGNDILENNEEGFTTPHINLNSIPYDKIKLRANLSTKTSSTSPKIFSWTVTWQIKPSRWQDLFNSEYRIDERKRVNVDTVDGMVNITPISADWSMFGQNTQNTRASEGHGADSAAIYWFSKHHENNIKELHNPVISDDSLYITTTDGLGHGHLYSYEKIQIPEDKIGGLYPYEIYEFDDDDDEFNDDEKDIVGSPAVSDKYVIVATGETHKNGIENNIYALEKNKHDSPPKWTFTYDDDICYWGSPVITDDKVYIATWSGDNQFPQSNENNKLLALLLENEGDLRNSDLEWEFDLPEGSYSTPAVYNDLVVIGCDNPTGDSLFVLDAESGKELWNKSVGAIGKSSPVIYENKVFIVSKSGINTQVTAIDIDNSTIIWEYTISSRPLASADTTPAVYDDTLYVNSPNGNVYALDTETGEKLWEKNLYPSLLDNFLLTSPAYADGMIYVSSPDGYLYALDALNNGTIKWNRPTFPTENNPAVTSPIVYNGLVFFGDSNGRLYSCGSYQSPDEEISGSIISIPIEIPTGNWWKKFYAEFDTPSGSSIKFSILDEEKNILKSITNRSSIALTNKTIGRTLRLQADLSADNASRNPQLLSWNVTYEPDSDPPDFDTNSFLPNPEGWLNKPTPDCSINVWDNGTGLNLGSASYVIQYEDKNNPSPETYTGVPDYSGEDGTDFTTLFVNISALGFSENISNFTSIKFSISDMAGNPAEFYREFKQDILQPVSSIDNEINGFSFNSEIVIINATAEDETSGIASVRLYYRHSTDGTTWDSWTGFGEVTSAPFSWNFTDVRGGGYYELYSIATDNADNIEDEPESGDVSFILDHEIPPEDAIDFLSTPSWFTEKPTFRVKFKDDFLLKSVEYQPNFDTTAWELINLEEDIDKRETVLEWDLTQEYWDQMQEGEIYYISFKLTDFLGNEYITPESERLQIEIDEAKPNVDLEIPTLETEWSFEDTFKITAFATDGDGSGIKTVELRYRYSEDGDFDDVNWSSYGDGGLTSEPFEWEFTAAEGNGYYEFYVRAEDLAGNVAESEVFSTGINIFPIFSVIAMVILIIALILITIVIIIKCKKK